MSQDMESSFLLDAQPNVYKHMIGYATSAAVRAAIQLRIPTIISEHRSPMSLQDLAAATKISPAKANTLYRLMRLLENAGFVALAIDQGEERYKLTPSSELLIEGKTPCVGPFFDLMHHKAVLSPLGSLADWLKEDGTRTPFDFTHGATLWDYIENNSKFKGVADRAMDCDSETLSLAIGGYKTVFEGAKTVVDVGGGRGDLAKIIVQEFPDVRCTVLDLPHVVDGLRDGENLEFKSGDMFKHVPPADVVMLKLMLHAWNDDQCVTILKNCKEAVEKVDHGKVVIIDIVLKKDEDPPELHDAKLNYDFMTMVLTNGQERSEENWKKLFFEAGFSSYKIIATLGIRSFIEVFP